MKNIARIPIPAFLQWGINVVAMVQLLNLRVLVASLVLFVAASGCAHRKPAPPRHGLPARAAPPPPPPPPPPKKLKLMVLPLDKQALPGTAEQINSKLAQVKLPGVEDATLATVSMETAQLQSECADPTETCYLKIARLVDADRLLWAQVEKVAAKGRKRGKKNHTRVQIILFDRDKLAVSGQADETFAGPVSGEDLDKLILTATGVRPGTAAPQLAPPPAAPPPPVATSAMAPPTARPAAAAPLPAARPAYAPQPAPPGSDATARGPPAGRPRASPDGYPAPAAARPPAAYPPPAAAYPPPPAAYPPPAAAPPPAAYPPPAAAPPPAAYPPPAAAPPSYAPPAATPPPASGPAPARWQ